MDCPRRPLRFLSSPISSTITKSVWFMVILFLPNATAAEQTVPQDNNPSLPAVTEISTDQQQHSSSVSEFPTELHEHGSSLPAVTEIPTVRQKSSYPLEAVSETSTILQETNTSIQAVSETTTVRQNNGSNSPQAVAETSAVRQSNYSFQTVTETSAVLLENSSPLQAERETPTVGQNSDSLQAVTETATSRQRDNSFYTRLSYLSSEDTSRACSDCQSRDQGDDFPHQRLEVNGSVVELSTQTLGRCIESQGFLTVSMLQGVEVRTLDSELSVSYVQNDLSSESEAMPGTCWLNVVVPEGSVPMIELQNQTCTPGNSILIAEKDPRGKVCETTSDGTRDTYVVNSGNINSWLLRHTRRR